MAKLGQTTAQRWVEAVLAVGALPRPGVPVDPGSLTCARETLLDCLKHAVLFGWGGRVNLHKWYHDHPGDAAGAIEATSLTAGVYALVAVLDALSTDPAHVLHLVVRPVGPPAEIWTCVQKILKKREGHANVVMTDRFANRMWDMQVGALRRAADVGWGPSDTENLDRYWREDPVEALRMSDLVQSLGMPASEAWPCLAEMLQHAPLQRLALSDNLLHIEKNGSMLEAYQP